MSSTSLAFPSCAANSAPASSSISTASSPSPSMSRPSTPTSSAFPINNIVTLSQDSAVIVAPKTPPQRDISSFSASHSLFHLSVKNSAGPSNSVNNASPMTSITSLSQQEQSKIQAGPSHTWSVFSKFRRPSLTSSRPFKSSSLQQMLFSQSPGSPPLSPSAQSLATSNVALTPTTSKSSASDFPIGSEDLSSNVDHNNTELSDRGVSSSSSVSSASSTSNLNSINTFTFPNRKNSNNTSFRARHSDVPLNPTAFNDASSASSNSTAPVVGITASSFAGGQSLMSYNTPPRQSVADSHTMLDHPVSSAPSADFEYGRINSGTGLVEDYDHDDAADSDVCIYDSDDLMSVSSRRQSLSTTALTTSFHNQSRENISNTENNSIYFSSERASTASPAQSPGPFRAFLSNISKIPRPVTPTHMKKQHDSGKSILGKRDPVRISTATSISNISTEPPSPSTVAIRQVVANKASLKPKMKSFIRISRDLMDEMSPLDYEIKQEARVTMALRDDSLDEPSYFAGPFKGLSLYSSSSHHPPSAPTMSSSFIASTPNTPTSVASSSNASIMTLKDQYLESDNNHMSAVSNSHNLSKSSPRIDSIPSSPSISMPSPISSSLASASKSSLRFWSSSTHRKSFSYPQSANSSDAELTDSEWGSQASRYNTNDDHTQNGYNKPHSYYRVASKKSENAHELSEQTINATNSKDTQGGSQGSPVDTRKPVIADIHNKYNDESQPSHKHIFRDDKKHKKGIKSAFSGKSLKFSTGKHIQMVAGVPKALLSLPMVNSSSSSTSSTDHSFSPDGPKRKNKRKASFTISDDGIALDDDSYQSPPPPMFVKRRAVSPGCSPIIGPATLSPSYFGN